jgi:geranylgeranyl reductase family protein
MKGLIMAERFDVVVVGGGPAGSSCARRLIQAGLRVVVIDQKTFPRDKTCAGWVTPPVWSALQVDLADYESELSLAQVGWHVPESSKGVDIGSNAPTPLSGRATQSRRVLQPITGFRTGLIGGHDIETRYDHVVSYGIRRCEFDTYLLNRCGAELRTGQPVRSVVRHDGCWHINDAIKAPLLVGAGGHFCPVARMLGAREVPGTSVVTAQEIEFEAGDDDLERGSVKADTPELFFCKDLNGYGWCFRKGSFLNIGLGRVGPEHLADHVAAFVQFLRDRGKLVADFPGRFHGHAYQLYERAAPKLVDDGVLLIGDAAGFAHPQSGEGIRPAVESGLIAADVLRDSRGDLSLYADRIAAHFGHTRTSAPFDWLPHSWLSWAARRLLASNWFTRRVVLDQWFLGQAV